ncbi:MAG: class I SAM-dependent methyltransferase [Gammaproteobacteria bacterium]
MTEKRAGERPSLSGYQNYKDLPDKQNAVRLHLDHARQESRQRLEPSLRSPDFLVYAERRKHIIDWLRRLPKNALAVLDLGGRICPYKTLLSSRATLYVCLDPQLEGLVDIVGIGEHMPFKDSSFSLVVCTQVLNYAASPDKLVSEIHRVLVPQGYLILSAPALFPRHHDERWRFLPDGLKMLLANFSDIEIRPEGYSIAGICRTINVSLKLVARDSYLIQRILGLTVFPLLNLAGLLLDRFSRGKDFFTTNYVVLARK